MDDVFEQTPIIPAVKDDCGLKSCLACNNPVVFVLYGTVVTLPDIVAQLKQSGKSVFVDIDLVEGLAPREAAVDFVAESVRPAGLISTKAQLVRRASALHLLTVYRTFLIDSMALQSIWRTDVQDVADYVEILPGVMTKIIRKVRAQSRKPVIASGMIADKEDVMAALSAGATAISSTNPAVWEL